MAQKYVVQVIDDLDGTELDQDDVEEVHFGLEGRSYVIDLSKTNAEKFRDTLNRYADAARSGQIAGRANTSKTTRGPKDLEQVRDWANANGHPVASRGRVPKTVLDAYDAYH